MKPTVHLICTAHLDPVWQWRWDEGAAEALATFGTAADLLDEHPDFIFCHNEAVLYQWVEELDPGLFKRIKTHVRAGRWAVGGGWYLQPDANLPGLESLVRQIGEGRRYFRDKFGAVPVVAYNFDSFGHSGGLPQILKRAGYGMYVHMRPQAEDLALPSDLYRWRGVDGTEVLAYRIAVGLYHTERDNIEKRLQDAGELALRLGRDVPVFWGLGDHGGGATREDLRRIAEFRRAEKRVSLVHSTPDRVFAALKKAGKTAPVVTGDLERCFTGCYTSLSRLKRRAQESLGLLVQTEALRAAAWWAKGLKYPAAELRRAWNGHLFNDFHDILSGSCTEPAEHDALALYGKVEDEARRLRLGAAAAFNRGRLRRLHIPVTVLNANPALTRVPVEVECMADYRPFWTGTWHLRLYDLEGREIPCQEEQPEALLPFNGWRRKLVFMAELPGLGARHYEARAFAGQRPAETKSGALHFSLSARVDAKTGLIDSFAAGPTECLAGPMPRFLVVHDDADSWGTGRWSYRDVTAEFALDGAPRIIEQGPVRTVTESVFVYRASRVVLRTAQYPDWPVLGFELRVTWNEENKRLKLSLPTRFSAPAALVEVPGGAIRRPADGDEHVHGRWLMIEGDGETPVALGLAHSGLHGFDFREGEVRLSVLRSPAYCHERGFVPAERPIRKYSDIGVHEIRFFMMAGTPDDVRSRLPGLADGLSSPPFALAHLPVGAVTGGHGILSVEPANIRMTACKQAWDGQALVIRLHEAAGMDTAADLKISLPGGTEPGRLSKRLRFKPFEIKSLRVERDGSASEVRMIEERREKP
jgi:alpha-mannosidase